MFGDELPPGGHCDPGIPVRPTRRRPTNPRILVTRRDPTSLEMSFKPCVKPTSVVAKIPVAIPLGGHDCFEVMKRTEAVQLPALADVRRGEDP